MVKNQCSKPEIFLKCHQNLKNDGILDTCAPRQAQTSPRDTLEPMRLAAGRRHFVVLRPDGTVWAEGDNGAGECDVETWSNITSVAAGNVHPARNTGRSHTVGLRKDGTVVATGWNGDRQCDVDS